MLLFAALLLALGGCGTRSVSSYDEDLLAGLDQSGDSLPEDQLEGADTWDGGDVKDPLDGGDGSGQTDGIDPLDVVEGSDTGGDTGGELPNIVTCPGYVADQGAACTATSGSGPVRVRGVILAGDRVLAGGEVLLSAAGQIECVDCDCSAFDGAEAAAVIDCGSAVVSPGLINAHDHLTFDYNKPGNWGDERYEHRHDWRKALRGHTKISVPGMANKAEMIWTEMRQVMVGTTSMAGSGSTAGFLRNLDKKAQQNLTPPGDINYSTFPLGDSDGILRDGSCDYSDGGDDKTALDYECYLPHVSEGIDREARNEFLCLSSDENGGVYLTTSNAAFIHCVGLIAEDAAELAAKGTAVVWSPRSNISLYGNTAPMPLYKRAGVRLAIGTDWTASGSVNILRELACALFLNESYWDGAFSDKELWQLATTGAARALAIDDAVGILKTGLAGDLVVYAAGDWDNPYRSVLKAGVKETLLVLRSGLPLYGDPALVAAFSMTGCEEFPGTVCGAAKAICPSRETGFDFAYLSENNVESYPLFFCGTPDNEPTCVPMRPGEYDGTTASGDLDGDGLANASDNCPRSFNPIRPLDGGAQGDFDTDGLGDLCDPCPFNPDKGCKSAGTDDWDSDGTADDQDNCPEAPNPGQEDDDEDDTGNACDTCPWASNPGGSACPVGISDLKQGLITTGMLVAVRGVVSAVADPSFFVEALSDEVDPELGRRFSGLSVVVPDDNPLEIPLVQIGQVVVVTGRVKAAAGQWQLSSVEKVIGLGTLTPPAPVAVSVGELAADSTLLEALESVLVRVDDALVSSLNPPPTTGDTAPTNEFELEGFLRVDDFMHLADPMPVEGDLVDVTGVLRLTAGAYKLLPRFQEDLNIALALRGFSAQQYFVKALQVGAAAITACQVQLTRDAPAGGTVVELESADPDRVTVPATVKVPAGARSAQVMLSAAEASDEPVEILARYDGREVTSQVLVVDPARVPVAVAVLPSPLRLTEGDQVDVVVVLDVPAPTGGVVVNLAAAPAGLLDVDAKATLPAGTLEFPLTITALASGEGELTLGTSAGDLVVPFAIGNQGVGLVVLSEVFYDPASTDNEYEWVEIANRGSKEVDLSGWSLAWAGTNYDTGRFQLEGKLPAGGCVVVGGPMSGANNFSPTFLQAQDFSPDVQNSGSAADAVALFNLPAESVDTSTVPADAVIYGGSNSNNLLDETGAAGAVDVGDAPSMNSLERQGSVWKIQAKPSPNDCSKALAN
jgi:cytosine/adenosine deaminase-related metal-dependent hydrolase